MADFVLKFIKTASFCKVLAKNSATYLAPPAWRDQEKKVLIIFEINSCAVNPFCRDVDISVYDGKGVKWKDLNTGMKHCKQGVTDTIHLGVLTQTLHSNPNQANL